MEPWHIAIALKPFILVAFFCVVACIAIAAKFIWPAGPLKDLLFDRTFRKTHPVKYGIFAVGLWLGFIASLAITVNG